MPGAVRCARLFGVCAPLVLMLVLKASLAVAQTPSPPAPRCGALCLLDGNNRPLDASQDSLAISTFITNGPTLPTDAAYTGTSLAASDVRVQVTDPKAPKGAFATLESRTRSGALRASLRVPLTRPTAALPLRSAYVRLVADEIDQHARGAESRTLRVALRDYVVVRYQNAALTLSQHLRVGEPGDRDAPGSARRASVHHFYGAAGQPEGHRPQRAGLRPVDQLVHRGGDEAFLEYAFDAHDLCCLLPIESALLPFVDEAHDQDGEEDHHGPET